MSPAPRPASKDNRAAKKPLDNRGPRANTALKRALRGESVQHEPLLAFDRTNYALMGSGVVLAALGFLLLRGGDISVAPFLIVIGYCGCIPAGILWRKASRPRGAGGGAAGTPTPTPAGGGAGRTGE